MRVFLKLLQQSMQLSKMYYGIVELKLRCCGIKIPFPWTLGTQIRLKHDKKELELHARTSC